MSNGGGAAAGERQALCIDGRAAGNYNGIMENQKADDRVDHFICMYRTEPKRRVLASDGALYVALLLAVIAIIMLANALSMRYDWPRALVQISLYALLLICGYLVYRFRLLVFRYTLTERVLSVERIVGQKIRREMRLHLKDIESIRPCREDEPTGRRSALHTGRLRDAWTLRLCVNGERRAAIISPSEEFAGKLLEQWKSLKT